MMKTPAGGMGGTTVGAEERREAVLYEKLLP